jgi:rhomboid protease GluP
MGIQERDYWRNHKPPAYNDSPQFFAITITVLIVTIHGAALVADESEALIQFGAANWEHVFQRGEYWRILTSMLLQAGIPHLLANSIFGFQWVRSVEQQLGSIQTAAWYFLTGMLASITSCVFQNEFSVGASGAGFGMIGISLALKTRSMATLGDFFGDKFVQANLASILLVSILGADAIDHYGHAG